jgi:hypothetical protein
MEIAALVSFGVLLVAWILAPTGSVRGSVREPRPAMPEAEVQPATA